MVARLGYAARAILAQFCPQFSDAASVHSGYNVGEFFQNSILPLAELLAAGAITRDVLLAPEVGGWPLVDYQLQMLAAFSRWPPTTPARVSPRCAAGSADGCAPPRCFRKLLLCRFRDVYDRQPPVAPWSAAQTIVRAMRRGPPHAPPPAATVAPLRVFFADRSGRGAGKNGARLITNQAALLDACARWRPPAACVNTPPWTARCELRAFGRRGFRADALAMQEADVLVGTHGAALVNALFMRRGGALLEVRPYNFDGAWPDRYHLAMAQRENATHAFVVRTRNRSLCTPVPPANVSAWNARPLNTHVREAAFTAGLAAAVCTSGRAAAAGAPPLPAAAWSVGAPLASPVEYSALPSVFLDNV